MLELCGVLDSETAKLVRAALGDPVAALEVLAVGYPDLVTPFLAAVGDLTAAWYEAQPPRPGAPEFTAEPAELPTVGELAANANWAVKQSAPVAALQGSAHRRLFKMHRDTVAENARREGVPWVREAREGACGTCRVMATRVLTEGFGGAPGLYRTEQSATAGHDHCRCIAVPLRGGDDYAIPDYVHVWLDDYEAVSRDESGRLLSLSQIAARMEARARDRGEQPGEDDAAAVVDLDATSKPAAAKPAEADQTDTDDEDGQSLPADESDDRTGESPLDRALRELSEAIESGDDARIEAAADAAERAENAERRAAERRATAAAQRELASNAESDRILDLIESGWDPQEAEAEVRSVSVEQIRRRDFMAQARSDGHEGKGFDDLVASVFRERVEQLYVEAENATRGRMVKRQFVGKFVPRRFWYVNDATARRYMSEELAAWFDENGRLTRPALRQMILDGSVNYRGFSNGGEDYLQ